MTARRRLSQGELDVIAAAHERYVEGKTGGRRAVSCDYSLSEKDQVEFRLGDYDATLPLVIDPVLVYSTYIGGVGTDTGLDIAVDGEGAAYISGQTSSSDFPANQIRPTIRNFPDAYVLKINPAGDAIVFGALIGGDGGVFNALTKGISLGKALEGIVGESPIASQLLGRLAGSGLPAPGRPAEATDA